MSPLSLSEQVSNLQGQIDVLAFLCVRLLEETSSKTRSKIEFRDMFDKNADTLSKQYVDGLNRLFEYIYDEPIKDPDELSPQLKETVKRILQRYQQ